MHFIEDNDFVGQPQQPHKEVFGLQHTHQGLVYGAYPERPQ